jgi:hypothetical protein
VSNKIGMRRLGHTLHIGERQKISIGETQWNRPFGKPTYRWIIVELILKKQVEKM